MVPGFRQYLRECEAIESVVNALSDVKPKADEPRAVEMTSSLEDYLETIYVLVRDQKFARVPDHPGHAG